jgi:hypothetical protein
MVTTWFWVRSNPYFLPTHTTRTGNRPPSSPAVTTIAVTGIGAARLQKPNHLDFPWLVEPDGGFWPAAEQWCCSSAWLRRPRGPGNSPANRRVDQPRILRTKRSMTKSSIRSDRARGEAWQAMAQLVMDNQSRREVIEKTGLTFRKMRARRRIAAPRWLWATPRQCLASIRPT